MRRKDAIDATKTGVNMRAAREAKGISRAELARKVNMYPDLIRRYEAMEVCPGIDKLILLANTLGIGLDEYVAGIVTRTQPNEPLTQSDLNGMDYDKVWLDYGDDGEWALVVSGRIYSLAVLEGSGFEDILRDEVEGETMDCPSGDYTVYRRPPEGEEET